MHSCSVKVPTGLLDRYPALRKHLKVSSCHISKVFRVKWSKVRSYLIKKKQTVYKHGIKSYEKQDRAYWKQVAFMDKIGSFHNGDPKMAMD